MYAKILADSISHTGHRLTTMEVRTWRFVLAEFNTHRVFSRNSASSRAIPVSKQLERVRTGMAVPLEWPSEQRGMQGGDEVEDARQADSWWRAAGEDAANWAEAIKNLGVHKSVTNRLLEPFMWHTIVVTSTEWDNFFTQRCSPLAQPEIRATAEAMRDALDESVPRLTRDNEWHLPYISDEDETAALVKVGLSAAAYQDALDILTMVSAARCARVSYLTQDGKRDITEDIILYNRLVSADPPHWSPLEHVATPWRDNVEKNFNLHYYEGGKKMVFKREAARIGNLTGWMSLRTRMEAVPER